MTDPKEVVRAGYDVLGAKYGAWTDENDPKLREVYIDRALGPLDDGSLVIELGSGSGVPTARLVLERHRLVCVDSSRVQLDLVAQNAPAAMRVQSDMSAIQFGPGGADAVVAFYSIIHVPRDEHADLFRSIARWLRPGGIFVACLGARDDPGTREAWIDDVEMYWSFFDPPTTLRMIEDAGIHVRSSEVLENFEDGRPVQFLWVIAERAG